MLVYTHPQVCAFPLNLICICFKADVDESYSIADIKVCLALRYATRLKPLKYHVLLCD